MDTLPKELRSRNMSRVRSEDTKPEKIIRSLLFRQGYRFRLHRKDLPGTPDLVLPKFRTVVFIHGCFWHHHACAHGALPETRREWWTTKLEGNRKRDEINYARLIGEKWRVAVIWECAFTRMSRVAGDSARNCILDRLTAFFHSDDSFLEI